MVFELRPPERLALKDYCSRWTESDDATRVHEAPTKNYAPPPIAAMPDGRSFNAFPDVLPLPDFCPGWLHVSSTHAAAHRHHRPRRRFHPYFPTCRPSSRASSAHGRSSPDTNLGAPGYSHASGQSHAGSDTYFVAHSHPIADTNSRGHSNAHSHPSTTAHGHSGDHSDPNTDTNGHASANTHAHPAASPHGAVATVGRC